MTQVGSYPAAQRQLYRAVPDGQKPNGVDIAEFGVPIVAPGNITNKFRDEFNSYDPIAGGRWTQQLGSGDIVVLDGNAAARYLVISKDPLSAGTETRIESVPTFEMPFDGTFGIHRSQGVVGTEFEIGVVVNEPATPAPSDIQIASISQAASVLSITTTGPHGLRPGARMGTRDVPDSRLNYAALVVASAPTPNTLTATAGPAGTIPAVTAGPFTSGAVFLRPALGGAADGTSMLMENATLTNASFYVRSQGGDVLPSGVANANIIGNHSVSILSTASTQAINAAQAYSFQPSNEFRLSQFITGVQWSDCPVDSVAATTNRAKRTQIVPDASHDYRLRFRAWNSPSLTRPIAQIVSATKTGTTTATVVLDRPHGLTLGDQINGFTRDTVNFPNLTTATAIASIVNPTTITVVWGGAVTATSFGGVICRVNGGQNIQGVHAGGVIQSIVRTNNILTVTGNNPIGTVLIGDYINVVGCRNAVDGSSMGVDGAYRIRNIVSASVELEPVGNTPIGADIPSTNCGGLMIRRTCLRIGFVRVLDFERHRVEVMPRPSGDIAEAISVAVQNTISAAIASALPAGANTIGAVNLAAGQTLGTLTALTGGGAAEDAAAGANPVVVGGVVQDAVAPTTLVAGDAVRDRHGRSGAKIVKPFSVPEAGWNASLALTTTTPTAIQAAGGAGLKRHITALQAINTGAAAVDLIILDGATERWRMPLPVNVPISVEFPTELATTAATALNANLSAAGTVRLNAQGYTSA